MARVCFALMSLLLALLAGTARAAPGASPHMAIRLLAETIAPAAGGEVTLALAATPEPGWHGYWQNPGDAGVGTRLTWTLPAGVTAAAPRYPVPQRLTVAGIMNYVYEGPFASLVPLRVPEGLAPGTRLAIRVRAEYLVCTETLCVPESADLATELVVGDGAARAERRAQFDRWRAAMPRPLGSAASFAVVERGGARTVRLAIPYPASAPLDGAYFFPLDGGALDHGAPQAVTRDGDRVVVEVAAGEETPAELRGVLSVGDGQGLSLSAAAGDVPAARRGNWLGAALLAFGAAVLGGVLLNVMPCVFPILSLKALHLVRSGASTSHARRDALGYTAGVVVTCLALGGALLGLRAAGVAAGWAFQLTDPRVVLVLLLLVSAIALNLGGLFVLPTPSFAGRGGSTGAFATGALAAFVATPCTGPFLGAALGAALVLPTAASLAIFGGLGLGLALPFLLLGFVPALRRRLPRPGAWMERFQRILSVPMFATAVALAWLLGKQAGADGMALGLAATVVAAIGLWWTGRRQVAGAPAAWMPAAAAILLALTSLAMVRSTPNAQAQAVAGAEPFSEARLATLRASGKPVFAYFTADWCVTCKVNEKAAIETDAVHDAFAQRGVQVVVGDWTNGNPAVGRFLEAHGRAGVPLYLWYRPGATAPEVLPQVLTPSILVERTRRA